MDTLVGEQRYSPTFLSRDLHNLSKCLKTGRFRETVWIFSFSREIWQHGASVPPPPGRLQRETSVFPVGRCTLFCSPSCSPSTQASPLHSPGWLLHVGCPRRHPCLSSATWPASQPAATGLSAQICGLGLQVSRGPCCPPGSVWGWLGRGLRGVQMCTASLLL